MKPAVPGEVIYAGGGFEEHHWRARSGWRVVGDEPCHPCDLMIIEVADQSASETLV
jgi:hypothetical protein